MMTNKINFISVAVHCFWKDTAYSLKWHFQCSKNNKLDLIQFYCAAIKAEITDTNLDKQHHWHV